VDVGELLRTTADWFKKQGLESPRLDAELLLGHVLGLDRLRLYTSFDRPVTPGERDRFRELVRRRGRREPVAYILGRREFFSRDFAVDRRVLIPRPDTETLLQAALDLLGPAREPAGEPGPEPGPEPPPGGGPLVLDYGTGSGCVAVTLACERPTLRVLALDVSADALAVAKSNVERHGVADRVGFVRGDGLAALPERFRAALSGIVANPPYVPEEERARLAPDVRDWEPALALFPGSDALLHYRRLAAEAGAWLSPGGWLAMEVGAGQAAAVADLLHAAPGWTAPRSIPDLARIDRVVVSTRSS
jgi:release factor glutamine methyltransferase